MSTYGSKLNAQEINRFLDFSFQQNEQAVQEGRRGTPICVWGSHGIGKTETLINFAKSRGYTTIYVAPAQFEEMGDLHGIPEVFNPTPELLDHGNELTIYRPPQWLKDAIQTIEPSTAAIIVGWGRGMVGILRLEDISALNSLYLSLYQPIAHPSTYGFYCCLLI